MLSMTSMAICVGRIYKLGEGERATESRCNHHAKPAFAG